MAKYRKCYKYYLCCEPIGVPNAVRFCNWESTDLEGERVDLLKLSSNFLFDFGAKIQKVRNSFIFNYKHCYTFST